MGKRGTKPLPTSLKIERGTIQASKIKQEIELPVISLYPEPPERFNDYSKGAWQYLLPKLMGFKIVSETDLFQFENMCYVYGEWRKACDEVETGGMTYVSDKGNIMPNPMVHIASSMFKGYNQIAAKFGLTPSDRVGLPNTATKKVDPLEELMNAANGG